MKIKPEVLCVDDEPQVLEGLRLHLKQQYVVHTAAGGAAGLEKLREHPSVAVILSDMRMPVMDGAKFLHAARTAAPDSVRMLLTGYTDMQAAISAVNDGQIFRFISKPCPPDQLLAAFSSALAQHNLIIAEKVLLQQTLLGCVESLAKVLSLTKPAAFGRALRLRAKVHAVVTHLGWGDHWHIEAAAILSQLGAVTLSEETLMKLNEGEPLDDSDRRELAASIDTSMQLLQDIPRLEPVMDVLAYLAASTHPTQSGAAKEVPSGASLLRIVLDWDSLEAQGFGQTESLQKLSAAKGAYDALLLEKIKTMSADEGGRTSIVSTSLQDLAPGMVLAQDLLRKNGVVILPRGFEIDGGLLDHIRTFSNDLRDEPVKVFAH